MHSNTVTFTYDAAGRKATETIADAGMSHTVQTAYDAAGRVAALTYPDGSVVTRTHTAGGQLAEVSEGPTTYSTRTYDPGGRLAGEVYNNGVSATRSYNADNTLLSIDHSGSIGDYAYSWDANHNKTAETITGVMSVHGFDQTTYDEEDRLTGWSTQSRTQLWNLSAVCDWQSYSDNGTVQNRTHGDVHQLLSVAGQAVGHDAKGNQTLLPPGLGRDAPLTMSWDFENRLSGADVDFDGVVGIRYRWDALGRRIGRKAGTAREAVYVHDGQRVIADYGWNLSPGTPGYRYVYGDYIDEPLLRYNTANNGRLYYHRNQQYSVVALSNSSEAAVERYGYGAYGTVAIFSGGGSSRTRSTYGNRYTYTGREWDKALSLYHYRARMYDPEAGRFCSRDPIGYWDGSSLYRAYFAPNGVDPSGLSPPILPSKTPPWGPFHTEPLPATDPATPYGPVVVIGAVCVIELGPIVGPVIIKCLPKKRPKPPRKSRPRQIEKCEQRGGVDEGTPIKPTTKPEEISPVPEIIDILSSLPARPGPIDTAIA